MWSFFNNKNIKISTPTQIDDFFRQLSYKNNKQILYVVLDSFLVEYYSSIDKNLDFRESLHFTELLEKEVSQKSIESDALRLLLKKYRDNRYEHRRNQIKMYKCEIKSRDPYSAFSILKDAFKPFEYFEAYFKHKVNNRIFIDCLYCKGDNFIPLKEEPMCVLIIKSVTFLCNRFFIIAQSPFRAFLVHRAFSCQRHGYKYPA